MPKHLPSESATATAETDSAADSHATPALRPRRAGPSKIQRFLHLVNDWLGITILFVLWVAMLLLVAHLVIIPRTCAQRWAAWVPVLGGITSMLNTGQTPRPECLAADSGLHVSGLSTLGSAASPATDGMTSYVLAEDAIGLSLALLAVAAMPLLLSFGAALISKWQQAPRGRHRFIPEQEQSGSEWSDAERSWKREAADVIRHLWQIEGRHAVQAQHRMMQHACLYGFATSAIFSWGILVNNSAALACQTRMMAVASAAAAFTSFSLSFARLTVRASTHDTSARMFAYALRALIFSVISAVLFVALLWHHGASGTSASVDAAPLAKDAVVLASQPFKGPTSYMMLGIVVALIGEGVLGQLTARAASVMSLNVPQRESEGAKQLAVLDGLTEQDILRLGEEGIDSIHALAMASTSALYFSTPYTLQRICDWQDQALLITYFGLAKAQMCREKLMVRGAIQLQRKADFLVNHHAAEASESQRSDVEKTFEIIRSSLGFISIEQARESLFPIAHDEVTRRLRIYQRGAVSEDLRVT